MTHCLLLLPLAASYLGPLSPLAETHNTLWWGDGGIAGQAKTMPLPFQKQRECCVQFYMEAQFRKCVYMELIVIPRHLTSVLVVVPQAPPPVEEKTKFRSWN